MPGTVPAWESFPQVNRALAGGLLGLLAWRMVAAGGSGGDERACAAAVGTERGQDPGLAS